MPPWAKWVLGIVGTAAAAGVVGAGATLLAHGERLATVEAYRKSDVASIERIETKVDKIDGKIDRLLGVGE